MVVIALINYGIATRAGYELYRAAYSTSSLKRHHQFIIEMSPVKQARQAMSTPLVYWCVSTSRLMHFLLLLKFSCSAERDVRLNILQFPVSDLYWRSGTASNNPALLIPEYMHLQMGQWLRHNDLTVALAGKSTTRGTSRTNSASGRKRCPPELSP